MGKKIISKLRPALEECLNGYGQWAYLRAKIAWAGWLGRKSAGLSKTKLGAIVILILLIWIGYCSFMVIRGFSTWRGTGIHLTPIQPINSANKSPNARYGVASEADYIRVKALHDYIDSLGRDTEGVRVHDSLLATRPGLMDSIRMMENYYESNLKR